MNILKINPNKVTDNQIKIIVNYFKLGRIIVYPTDTIYGLGTIATNKKSIDKIYRIKKRDKNKPMIVLIKSYCMLKKYCYISARQDKYLRKFWIKTNQKSKACPMTEQGTKGQKSLKPMSVVLKSRGLLPEELTGDGDSIAVRMPVKSELLMKVLKKVDLPIVSTSLNLSGKEVFSSPCNLEKYFGKNTIDFIIDAGILKGKSSNLIDIRDMDNIKVIRN